MRKQFLILVLASVCALGFILTAIGLGLREVTRSATRSKSEDHVQALLFCLLADRWEVRADALAHTGRNFILSAVASGALDLEDGYAASCLWPPGSTLPAASVYEQVTWESLESRRFAHLTGYAGPVNARAEPIGPAGTPLIADLTRPGGIIVAFSGYTVRFYSWDDLGIDPPDGPVVVGPGAKHALLRALSND